MRRYSPPYYSPPRRGYGGRERSPPRRGHGSGGGGYGRGREENSTSLLVRNIPLDCRPEELRVPFERFGDVRDVYIPRNYYTGEPRGFAFVQFLDPYDASEAQYHMNGVRFAGREISVVVAAETRKRPEEMRHRVRSREPSSYRGQRSSQYGRSPSRSISRSPSPRRPSGSRSRYRSRSYSPVPRRRSDYSPSPIRGHSGRGRSPGDREGDHVRKSYSPGYDDDVDRNRNGNGYESPPGSRSRSADMSPERSR